MSFAMSHVIQLGPSNTGLTLNAQLVDTAGSNVGSVVTTGFSELGNGDYQWYYTAFPDGHRGAAKILNQSGAAYLTSVSVNPEEGESVKDIYNANILQKTTIATLASQTSFTLTAGSTDNDAYNGATLLIFDVSTAVQKAHVQVLDYVGSTKTITLRQAPIFTAAVSDIVYIIPIGANNNLTMLEGSKTVDGITLQSVMESLLAFVAGETVLTDNGSTKTLSVKKQDGSTEKLSITFNADGEWTATVIS